MADEDIVYDMMYCYK